MSAVFARRLTLLLLLLVTGGAAGCARRRVAPPTPARAPQRAPDLTGAKVMLFPIQRSGIAGGGVGAGATAPLQRVPAKLEDEIMFWLKDRGADVRWVTQQELQRVVSRTPQLGVDLRGLAVGSFLVARVESIGDPLYGDLRKLGAITDARYALIPIVASYVPQASGDGRIEIAAALIDTSSTDVLWYGVAAGTNGAPGDPETIASAAQQLATQVIPSTQK